MTDSGLTTTTWDDLEIGEILPEISYVITSEMLAEYRDIVENPGAQYPTIAGRHPTRAFYAAHGAALRAPNMGYRAWYFNRPQPGTQVLVRSLIVAKFARREKRFIVVESRANDDSGRLIELSRLTGLVSKAGGPALAAVAEKGRRG